MYRSRDTSSLFLSLIPYSLLPLSLSLSFSLLFLFICFTSFIRRSLLFFFLSLSCTWEKEGHCFPADQEILSAPSEWDSCFLVPAASPRLLKSQVRVTSEKREKIQREEEREGEWKRGDKSIGYVIKVKMPTLFARELCILQTNSSYTLSLCCPSALIRYTFFLQSRYTPTDWFYLCLARARKRIIGVRFFSSIYPPKNDFGAHILATVYGQYIGKILATLPTLAQYMGNMWLRRLSWILATLFPISCPHSWLFSKCGLRRRSHILPIHCPQIFFTRDIYTLQQLASALSIIRIGGI